MDVYASDAESGNFSTIPNDLESVNKLNFEFYIEHFGLGEFQAPWLEIVFGSFGGITVYSSGSVTKRLWAASVKNKAVGRVEGKNGPKCERKRYQNMPYVYARLRVKVFFSKCKAPDQNIEY